MNGLTLTRYLRAARRWRPAIGAASAMLALLVALGGCGSSAHKESASSAAATATAPSNTTGPTGGPAGPTATNSSPQAHRASMLVLSHARMGNLVIDPHYTCHGADQSPPMVWAGAPPTTRELMVFVRMIYQGRVTTAWAVAGIKPTVHKFAAGEVPAGAVVGRNSAGQTGYHLCPQPGALVTMGVYAFPRLVGLKTGFDPDTVKHLLASPEVQWGGLPMLANAPTAAPPIR